ncbi:O-antigen ligase [Lachnospiraceae bacterium PF1-21]|uniref:O-antigen ligase family protein n=1 Tax=Ohessyouella blattaphilus TaxID=2949333 RepID=A0ABT1ELC8_9FIRM|nr:O-antigen ligase family protein [Ohessyouella blattaphilus]MCP1111502.1 O-antigen ligase family protein [Ohessyouella blattaphilus]MCR8564896.1 O-antigen ligase family protein [Ohessyouella blattaphilus]
MKIIINKREIVCIPTALLFVFFANQGGISTAFFSDRNIKYLLAVVFVLLVGIIVFKNRKYEKSITLPIFIYAFLMCFVSLNNPGWGASDSVVYIGAVFFVVVATYIPQIHRYILNFLFAAYIFYAISTIIISLIPSLYLPYVWELFPDTREMLLRSFRNGYISGFTNHYSTNGVFLASGFIIASIRYYEKKKKLEFALIVIMLVALLLTGKRAHLLFSIAALLGMFYLSTARQNVINRFFKTIAAISICVVIMLVVANYVPELAVVFERFRSFMEGNDAAVNARYGLWGASLVTFKRNPLIGIGWEQFQETVSAHLGYSRTYAVHNVYLQLLCESGIIGFAIYISWFIYSLRNAVQVYVELVKRGEYGKERMYIAYSASYQIFFLLYCLTGNPLYDKMTNLPYFFACGLGFYYKRKTMKICQ